MERDAKLNLKTRRCVLLSERLAALRTAESADVILVCEEKEFYAHQIVLEISAAFFVTILRRGSKEAKYIRAVVDGMDSETLEAILDFIYKGEVEHITSPEQFQKVAIVSTMLELVELRQYCCDNLGKTLSVSTFFERYDFNQKYSREGSHLEVSLLQFWEANAKKLVTRDNFLSLPFIRIKDFLLFLKKKHCSLDIILAGVLHWLRHNRTARELFVDDLFDCFDADFLSKDGVLELIRKHKRAHASESILSWLKALDAAILAPDSSRVPAASTASFPSNSRLTYFSNYRNIEVYDPSADRYVVTRSKPHRCIQQFDLTGVRWLGLETPYLEKAGKTWNGPLCQYGPHVYTIGDKKSWELKDIQEAQKNPLLPIQCPNLAGLRPDTRLCYFKDCLFAIGGSTKGRHTVFVHYIELGSGEWREGVPLSYVTNDMHILTSKEYIYVVCVNPRIPEELVIQYSFNPATRCEWEIMRILRNGLEPTQFFVLSDTLNAIYLDNGDSKQLAFNHSLKKMKTKRAFAWPDRHTQTLILSKFQNPEGAFVYFAKQADHFSLPQYLWEPETGKWAKLEPAQGKCEIPNSKSVRLVYDVYGSMI